MPHDARARTPVLFIEGKGRSGSTLLDNLLGQVPEVFSTGELTFLWDWGLRRGIRCGCGEDVLSCPVWSVIVAKAFDIRSREDDAANIEELFSTFRKVARYRYMPRLFTRRSPGRWKALQTYARSVETLYSAIADVTGARLIVDSSKTPLNPAALGLVDGIEGSAVHLVRDPRAVGHSWQRHKAWSDRAEGGSMPRYGPLHTSTSWTVRNIGAELVCRRWPQERCMLLRYEDFCREPRTVVRQIMELVDLPAGDLPFIDENTAKLGVNHTVGGNPNRMQTGDVTIRPDEAWKDNLGPASKGLITSLTWPLRRRYGYPLRLR